MRKKAVYYPDGETLLFTFSLYGISYACVREDGANVCMKIQWNLWRGYFCPEEDVPEEALCVCDRLLRAGEENPEKYELEGEHYCASLSEENRLRVGLAPRPMMKIGRIAVPAALRFLFLLAASCAVIHVHADLIGMWLRYLMPDYRIANTALYAVAAEAVYLFFLSGKTRNAFLLLAEAFVPMGIIFLIGIMKKWFLVALLMPIAFVVFYKSLYRNSERRAVHHALLSVALLTVLFTTFFTVSPYTEWQTAETEFSSETEARYRAACAALYEESFAKKTVEEKLEILQAICDYECNVGFGISSPRVYAKDVESEMMLGYYTNATSSIVIRNDYMTDKDAESVVRVLLHEIRHHMQHRLADFYVSVKPYLRKEYGDILPIREAALFFDNFQHYHAPEDNFELYQDQIVEADSRAWAEERILFYIPFIEGTKLSP